jgi:TetR/AcrR family transcriptional regulator, mexJK operon transcriptional repressor
MDLLLSTAAARVGRPTRAQAEARHRALLDAALEIFLERGFENATIRDIAAAIGMTRKSVYARYSDKRELFRAMLEHVAAEMEVATDALARIDRENLEEALIAAARLRIAATLTPTGLKLQRFLHTESYRFPELINPLYSRITGPTVQFVAELLRHHNLLGNTVATDPHRAAIALMNMVVGVPVRMILLGIALSPEEIEERIQFSVGLFINGVSRR